MLKQVADGVLVHESDFLQSNGVVVKGPTGVLLIDPGLRDDEMDCLASDVRALGQPVVAGFATHGHWDHVLWDERFGTVPRYGTARCAVAIEAVLSDPDWEAGIAEHLAETEVAGHVPLALFGRITGLPDGATRVPWDGPAVRIIEHQAHASGHASLLIEERGVLVAGDMLSDALIPFLDLEDGADPLGDYLSALELLEGVASVVDAVVPGHGSVGVGAEVSARIALDRAYVLGLRDGDTPDDPRLAPAAVHGAWLPAIDQWQRQQVGST